MEEISVSFALFVISFASFLIRFAGSHGLFDDNVEIEIIEEEVEEYNPIAVGFESTMFSRPRNL